jgi:UDP-galactopyranose mutase
MNILIVGAGVTGCVIARELAEAGFKISLIDMRGHIGGNTFDYINEFGIRVHKYGPHLFHTNNKVVFEYLSRYTEWIEYQHKVKAVLDNGDFVTLPVNADTISKVGKGNIIDIFYRPYSEKMWGMKLEDLNPDIFKRVPIRNDLNELYFPNDKYQYMPLEGYSKLFENMVNHENINLSLNTKFCKELENEFDFTFNSMPIDMYYDYCYGELPYRSIKFHNVSLPLPFIFPAAVINFTHNGPYTRVTEWKHIPNHGSNASMTSITYEEPCDYKNNNFERFYPVADLEGKNISLYRKYLNIKNKNVKFVGRLGLYSYLNMDQCVNIALIESKKAIKYFKSLK